MAPVNVNKMRTYSRQNRSLVNNFLDAGNLLSQRNKAKGRKKRKLKLKELPAGETLLGYDSFHISTEDTFDKLAKGNVYNPVHIKSHISIVDNSDSDASKSVKTVNNLYSPIITRRKKKIIPLSELSDISNNKNKSESVIPHLKEPTVEKIDFSLEVENVQPSVQNSLSYIVIPKYNEIDLSNVSATKTNMSFDPIFTKTFREKQLIHSSTPLAPMKTKIINYTISPIKNMSTLQSLMDSQQGISNNTSTSLMLGNSTNLEYLPENDWRVKLKPKVMLDACSQIESNSLNNYGFENAEFLKSKMALQQFKGIINEMENSLSILMMPKNTKEDNSRENFITLRTRKVLKETNFQPINGNRKRSRHEDKERNTEIVCGSKTVDEKLIRIEDVDTSVEKINEENESILSSNNTHRLSDFQLVQTQNTELLASKHFEDSNCKLKKCQMSYKKFVTKRRRLTDSYLISNRKQKTYIDNSCVASDNDYFGSKCPVLKDLDVNLTRYTFNQQSLKLDSYETNGSMQPLHGISKSFFEDLCINSNNLNEDDVQSNTRNSEMGRCSFIDKNEILSLIKQSIGSNMPSKEKRSKSLAEEKYSNRERKSNNGLSNSKQKENGSFAGDFGNFSENVTKRSESLKRDLRSAQVQVSNSNETVRSQPSSFQDEVGNKNEDKELVINLTKSPWRKKREQDSLKCKSSLDNTVPTDNYSGSKCPVFRDLGVNLTKYTFNDQSSKLDSYESNVSMQPLHGLSKSLFEDSCINLNNLNQDDVVQSNTSNTERGRCSLIDKDEILSLIKQSIGSNISSTEKRSKSLAEEKYSNRERKSKNWLSDNKGKDSSFAEDFETLSENFTKRSKSFNRDLRSAQVQVSNSNETVRSQSSSFQNEVGNKDVGKELVINLTKSPWKRKREKDSIKSKSSLDNTVIDLTDSLIERDVRKSNAVENISALKDTGVEHYEKHSISDIIESSVLESSHVDGDGFKIPNLCNDRRRQSKTLILKAGKLWRRSFSMYKRSSMILNSINENVCKLEDGNFCACPKCALGRQSMRMSYRRFSIRIVPAKPSINAQREISILENYAHNSSYVSGQIFADNLENDLRSLSLSKKNSVIQNSAPVTARELVLRKCGQEEPLIFEECYPKSVLQNCQKIGEGVYGEVFLFKNPNGGTSVMKVIPIEGDLIVNGERQKKFEEILSEITIALELSNLRNNKENNTSGFSEVQKVCCVQGCYPEKLIDLWDLYDETRGSENDSPEVFREDQLYIVLQLANGGNDLEAFIFNNCLQTYTMFQQVACSLAVAEEELRFEHRDLHWGNVLLSKVDKNAKVTFRLDGKNYDIMTRGVEVSIIDFTLSRIECDGVVIFNDLSLDPELFTAEGDYQFEIYKLMQKKNGNNWQRFEPHTNVLWLHYVLDKAIVALRYKNTQTKIHKEYLGKLIQLKDEILNYNSVKEFVLENF